MTRAEIEKLESWLHDGVHLLASFLLDRRDSLLDAATGVFSRDPIPAPRPDAESPPRPAYPYSIMDKPYEAPKQKRKRGRPKKTGIYPEPEAKPADETQSTCPYCNRVLPSGVIELHKDNCRAAAEGYATRVGQRNEP